GEDEVLPFAASRLEIFDHFHGAVENGDGEAFRLHIQDEVFAHHCKADKADVTSAHLAGVKFGGLTFFRFGGGASLWAWSAAWQNSFAQFIRNIVDRPSQQGAAGWKRN